MKISLTKEDSRVCSIKEKLLFLEFHHSNDVFQMILCIESLQVVGAF